MKKITIGARGSKLTQAYVEKVKNLIFKKAENISNFKIEIKTIRTSGDVFNNEKLSKLGGKKLFCKEIEENLIENKIDIAVHALKDMEAEEHKDLLIGAFIKRNDPRDVIISKKITTFEDLKNNFTIGSSSRRRELQLKKINKKISFVNMRGNIDTRIKKLSDGSLDGIILAASGIKTLKLEKIISISLDPKKFIPAVGQGIIAVQCRKNDNFIKKILEKINDKDSFYCAKAERSMLMTIKGDCDTAVGGLAEIQDGNLTLNAELFSDKGDENFRCEVKGRDVNALSIGKIAGEKLLRLAGSKFSKK